MKRSVALLLIAALCLFACSGCAYSGQDDGRLSVVCTIFPQYDIVRSIAGDSVDLKMLLPYSMESHDYRLENLSVKDLKTVAEADIIISIGGESDSGWIAELKARVGNASQQWLELSSMTATLCAEEHHHEASHSHEHSDDDIDEHIWTSPRRMIDAAVYIANVLKAADPLIASVCDRGLSEYLANLNLLDSKLAALGQGAEKPFVFADRFAFRYLFHDYGLDYEAAFTGCSSSVDPSALQIAELIKKAVNSGQHTVFYMENSNVKYAERIAKTIGGRTAMLHSCHNLSREEIKNGETYISIMQRNVKKLEEAME